MSDELRAKVISALSNSAQGMATNRFAMVRCSGTVTPRNWSDSPYSPGAVYEKTSRLFGFLGRGEATSLSDSSMDAAVCPPDFEDDSMTFFIPIHSFRGPLHTTALGMQILYRPSNFRSYEYLVTGAPSSIPTLKFSLGCFERSEGLLAVTDGPPSTSRANVPSFRIDALSVWGRSSLWNGHSTWCSSPRSLVAKTSFPSRRNRVSRPRFHLGRR